MNQKTLSILVVLAFAALGFFAFAPNSLAATANVTHLKITTSAQSVFQNTETSVIVVQSQNASSSAETVSETHSLSFQSSSSTGQFSDASQSTGLCNETTWSSSLTLNLVSGKASKGFCYKDSTSGTYNLTVSIQDEPTWTPASQSIAIMTPITNDQGGKFSALSAAVAGTTTGGTITVPAGTYDLTSELDINVPLTITGEGNVTILASNSFWDTTNTGKHLIGIYGGTASASITFSNLTFDCNNQCYGLNTYNNAYGVLNNVTVKNSRGAGLTVNGSTIMATDLNTSGNAWGAVNVDPGSGVTTPSVFTLNSGTLSENNQIWSDGSHVNSTATVTVNASGYNMYKEAGTTAFFFWTNKPLANAATIGTTAYSTIQAAVDAASNNDIVNIGSGTYNESLLVSKPLTLVGTSSTIIAGDGSHDYALKISGTNDVIINTIGVDGGGSAVGDNSLDYGIWIDDSGTTSDPITIENSTIKNIWQNGSNGIEIDGASMASRSYALIHGNTISSFHKRGIRFQLGEGKVYGNEIIGDHVDGTTRVQNLVNLWGGSEVEVYDNKLHDGMSITPGTWDSPAIFVSSYDGGADANPSNANIHDNTIYNMDTGVTLGSYYVAPNSDNSVATITNNVFHDDHTAINLERTDVTATAHDNSFGSNIVHMISADDGNGGPAVEPSVDAKENWWNSPTPNFASLITNASVSYDPWYINPGRTVLSSALDTGTGTITDTSGNIDFTAASGSASLPSSITNLVLNDSSAIDLSNSIASESATTVIIGGNDVSLTKAVILKSGTASTPVVVTNSNLNNVSVSIPDSTTIKGPDAWDGKISPPTSVTASGNAPSGFSVGNTVVSVGSALGTLVFDNPVSVVLDGVTGTVGYKPAGSSTWIQITNVCGGTYASPNNPPANGECYISDGTNTKIMTYHFTDFASLDVASTSTSSGGGGGGSISFSSTPTPSVTPMPSATPTATTTPVPNVSATPRPIAKITPRRTLAKIASVATPTPSTSATPNPFEANIGQSLSTAGHVSFWSHFSWVDSFLKWLFHIR